MHFELLSVQPNRTELGHVQGKIDFSELEFLEFKLQLFIYAIVLIKSMNFHSSTLQMLKSSMKVSRYVTLRSIRKSLWTIWLEPLVIAITEVIKNYRQMLDDMRLMKNHRPVFVINACNSQSDTCFTQVFRITLKP